MAIGTLKVTPEEMVSASSTLSGYVSQMQSCFDAVKRTMDATQSYWVGLAGDAHRNLYNQKIEKTQEFIARCNEHVRELNEMAGVYSEAETAATNTIEELPISNL